MADGPGAPAAFVPSAGQEERHRDHGERPDHPREEHQQRPPAARPFGRVTAGRPALVRRAAGRRLPLSRGCPRGALRRRPRRLGRAGGPPVLRPPPGALAKGSAPRRSHGAVGVRCRGGRRLRRHHRRHAGGSRDTRCRRGTAAPGAGRRPELPERGARLGDPDGFHGHVVAHLRTAPGAFGQLPHGGQMHGIGAGHLGQGDDRALGCEQSAVEVTVPGRLAVARAVGHGGDAQPAAVHEPPQLSRELTDLRVEFIGQGLPTRHCFPPLSPGTC